MEPGESVFKLGPPAITMKIKKFFRQAGIDDRHAHSLRSKYATTLLERGVNIRQVQHLLGHESLNTTQVYLSVVDSTLAEAVKVLDKEPEPKPMPLATSPEATGSRKELLEYAEDLLLAAPPLKTKSATTWVRMD